jgi:hypothetical protein
VFGRSKSEQTTAPTPVSVAEGSRDAGKGRATPKRREAEQRNRHPIVGGPALSKNATKEQRKAAKAAQRAAFAAARAQQRTAMMTGDEKHLPARDRGAARRYARDYVDARRTVGEYFIPVALVIMVFSLVNSPVVTLTTLVMLYAMVLLVVIDSFLIRRTVNRLTVEKFGDRATGAGTYAAMRALQLRRWRMPRAQVARGQYPT